MPELPEVETVRRGLAPAMEGRRILRTEMRRADLRFPFPENFVARVSGQKVNALGRRAKYLTAALSAGETLIMHLGMTGRFTVADRRLGEFVHETGADPKHDHLAFDMEGGGRITFNDPRRFGFVELWPTAELDAYPAFADMGPEPNSNRFSGAYLGSAFRGRKSPVKAALMDQGVVAGLGNIYVAEALFRAGVNPRRVAGSISAARLERLAAAVREVITEAIDAGGSSISDFAGAGGERGAFQHRFRVYDREGEACPTCAKPVKRLVQSGRSSFYCGNCQR
ncbi:MAG: bifunctional DNA-formamidopyrimidine glycosylase/DNA-(apurinic or apyrimidinic site) lyase [Alphaproteobacteria bacterium]|nr:bifunctional DNA-formamidopyrimidine glycosylase/DNA-(apurinic or apyrimidinic site) lyase [Alphaproteobacteria bacterium]